MSKFIEELREQDLECPEDYDLCVIYKGQYVDIVRSDVTMKWRLTYFNHRKWFTTRGKAIDWVEKHGLSELEYDHDEVD